MPNKLFKKGLVVGIILLFIGLAFIPSFNAVSISMLDNHPPEAPDIAGPITCKPGVSYDYTFVAVDPDGDDVYYVIDWYSTGSIVLAYGPYKSGEEAVISHTWPKGGIIKHCENKKDTYMYKISAKTKDIYDFESDWSEYMVSINGSKSTSTSPFFRFLEKFPLLHRLFDIWRCSLV